MINHFDTNLLRKNKIIFRQYAQMRREYAYELNQEKASVAFEIIPALLSVNEPELPGFVPDGEDACGVYGIGTSSDLEGQIHRYFPEMKKRRVRFQKYLVKRPIVESLFLMGSIGTVAQTEKSDFDFWVCVDSTVFDARCLRHLHKKTQEISLWCGSTFGMEVHFFISELDRVRENDFGRVDEESTGSSQKRFLKEECYRTMLFVAGKIPIWWVVPQGTDREGYYRLMDRFREEAPYDFDDFVDLGYLGSISREEFMGTALWHLSKGIKDPFKALLKMAMMEWYLSDAFEGRLLCDLLKERVLAGGKNLLDVDPYLLMVETVLDYYLSQGRYEHMDLVRKAFYLKADPGITRVKLRRGPGDYKTEAFRGLIGKWGWPIEVVEELNLVEKWSYARHLKLSTEINKFFFSTYRRLSDSQLLKERQAINDLDLTILGRRIYVLFSRQPKKLQLIPYLTGRRIVLDRCIFQYRRSKSGQSGWTLLDATRYALERNKKPPRIFTSDRIVRAAAWLVINGIFDSRETTVEMPSNPSGVDINRLIELLRHLYDFFKPGERGVGMGDALQSEAKYERIVVVVDMEPLAVPGGPSSIDLVYSNTWGEIFTDAFPFQEGLSVVSGYVHQMELKDPSEAVSRVKVYLPQTEKDDERRKMIYQAILFGFAGC